jgi:hypothetical protein
LKVNGRYSVGMAEEQPSKQKPNKADHLKPHRFQPGVSGNPGGRPKGGINLHQRVENELLRQLADGTIKADELAKKLVAEMQNDPQKMMPFILKLIDRDEGPVANNVVLETVFTVEDMTRRLEDLGASDRN